MQDQAAISLPEVRRDARLQKVIEGQSPGGAVEEFLSSLGDIPAEVSTPMRGHRVLVFARQKKQGDVLADIAALFGAQWEATSAEPGIILRLSPQTRRLEERLWNEALDRAAAPVQNLSEKAWQKGSEYWDKLRKNKDYATEKLPQAYTDLLSYPDGNAALRLLRTLSSQQRRQLFETESLWLPLQGMSESQSSLTWLVLSGSPVHVDEWERPLTAGQWEERSRGKLDQVSRLGLHFEAVRDPASGGLLSYRVGGMRSTIALSITFEEREAFESSLFPTRGCPYRANAEQASYSDFTKLPFPGDLVIPRKGVRPWGQVLAELAKRLPAEFTVLSDDFTGTRLGTRSFRTGLLGIDPRTGRAPNAEPSEDRKPAQLAEGLDSLCQAYNYLWWRDGNTLFFRSRAWFIEQRYEVPPQIASSLCQEFQRPTVELRRIMPILAKLTREQVIGLSHQGSGAAWQQGERIRFGDPRSSGDYYYSLIQIFSRLPAGIQQRVLSNQGCSVSQMPPDAQLQLLRFVLSKRSGQQSEQTDKLGLRIQPGKVVLPDIKEQADRRIQAQVLFSVQSEMGASPLRISCPVGSAAKRVS